MNFACEAIVHDWLLFVHFALPIGHFAHRMLVRLLFLHLFMFVLLIFFCLMLLHFCWALFLFSLHFLLGLFIIWFFRIQSRLVGLLDFYLIIVNLLLCFFFVILYSSCIDRSLYSFVSFFFEVDFLDIPLCFLCFFKLNDALMIQVGFCLALVALQKEPSGDSFGAILCLNTLDCAFDAEIVIAVHH